METFILLLIVIVFSISTISSDNFHDSQMINHNIPVEFIFKKIENNAKLLITISHNCNTIVTYCFKRGIVWLILLLVIIILSLLIHVKNNLNSLNNTKLIQYIL